MTRTERLSAMLKKLPPSLDEIESELQNNEYSEKEIAIAACEFAKACMCEVRDFEWAHERKPDPDEVHGAYIYSVCELLLRYGLNPNAIIDGENIMYALRHIDYQYAAAETMRLMLEKGGDVNIDDGDEPLFLMIDFDVLFDVVELENKELFDMEFRLWLVMIGYGATINGNKTPVEVVEGYSIDKFREFENYTCEIEFLKDDWIMHIIDTRTGTEVARL